MKCQSISGGADLPVGTPGTCEPRAHCESSTPQSPPPGKQRPHPSSRHSLGSGLLSLVSILRKTTGQAISRPIEPCLLPHYLASCLCASPSVYSQSPVYRVHLRDQNRSSWPTSPTAIPCLASPPGACGHPALRRHTRGSALKSHLLQGLTGSFLGSEPPLFCEVPRRAPGPACPFVPHQGHSVQCQEGLLS